jgi:hypothetical protein
MRYLASTEFKALDSSTQRQKQRVLESICLEPLTPKSEKLMGAVR